MHSQKYKMFSDFAKANVTSEGIFSLKSDHVLETHLILVNTRTLFNISSSSKRYSRLMIDYSSSRVVAPKIYLNSRNNYWQIHRIRLPVATTHYISGLTIHTLSLLTVTNVGRAYISIIWAATANMGQEYTTMPINTCLNMAEYTGLWNTFESIFATREKVTKLLTCRQVNDICGIDYGRKEVCKQQQR